ncbi:hypothetical protein XANCAGTX0491_009614 [Xanthoria calcicola]
MALDAEFISAQGLLGSHFGIPGRDAEYDYVVIGGGTAGLVIAHRLAQNSTVSVAVIEAGDFYEFSNGNYSEVPAYASYFTGDDPAQKNPYLDWYHYTEPQPQLNNRRSLYDSGKVIGGTSGRNFLWQVRTSLQRKILKTSRGSRDALRRWAEEVGDESYQFDNLLPFYQRSAQFSLPNNDQRPKNATASYNSSDWSPRGGPMHVGYSSWVNPMSSWLVAAFTDLGLKGLPSLLSGNLLGWSWLTVNVNPAQIRSSSEEFLREALTESPNLVVYKNTLAKQIIFKDGQATAVKVVASTSGYKISARREIILSAGVMRSPQLLMVSGVGPSNLLASLGIDVVADRPGVGQNMWDVVSVGPTYSVNVVTHSSLADPDFLASAVEQYNNNRSGILTNLGGDLAGFEKFTDGTLDRTTYQSLKDQFPGDWPHIVYLVLDSYFGSGSGNIPADLDITKQYAAASVGLVATFSRGNVSINSSDTANNPVISPNWLSDPRDLDMAVAAFLRARQLFNASGIRPIVTGEIYPGGNQSTRAEIIELVRQSANTIYNAVGTNKMGRRNDSLAVVDSAARVIGVNALAEKIADAIRRDLSVKMRQR